MDVHVENTAEAVTCRPVGELDAASVAAFRSAMVGLADGSNLIIDLSDVPFMDSAGLGALIGSIRRTREAGGEVALMCSRPTLLRLLETTGFDRIVSVVSDRAAALEGFSSRA
jgi:anti-sigma B factor antagonist